MGNRAKQLMDQGKAVLFAFEEAIGKKVCYVLVAFKIVKVFYSQKMAMLTLMGVIDIIHLGDWYY